MGPPTRPIKQPQPRNKTSYDHSMPSNEAFQPRREIQEFSPQIKTEVPVVLDCDEEPEDNHQMVETDEYSADQGGYEYDQSYQDQNMMYQVGEMDMGQVGDHTQGEQDFEDYVNKNSSKVTESQGNGMQCHLCNKITTHIGNMKQHFEVHHYNRSYKCEVCMKDFRTKNSLDVHKRRHGHYV